MFSKVRVHVTTRGLETIFEARIELITPCFNSTRCNRETHGIKIASPRNLFVNSDNENEPILWRFGCLSLSLRHPLRLVSEITVNIVIKYSQAIRRVGCLRTTDFSGTISVSIIRVLRFRYSNTTFKDTVILKSVQGLWKSVRTSFA
jgi:hypothetical protein